MLICFKKRAYFFAMVLLIIMGCKKSTTPVPAPIINKPAPPPPQHTGPDVYVVGDTYTSNGTSVATCWKNGVATRLEDSTHSSSALAIVVSGTDIYIVGSIDSVGAYWKNGKATKFAANISVTSLAVSGSDVYVAGSTKFYSPNYSPGVYYVATYWKNGTVNYLEDIKDDSSSNSNANAILVQGKNIYIAGNSWGRDGGDGRIGSGDYATYWKNGVATRVSDFLSNAYCIGVLGNDVYMAGDVPDIDVYGVRSGIVGGSPIVAYWKNGVLNHLADYADYINAIAFNGNTMYLVGTNVALTPEPFCWVNGAQTFLITSSEDAGGAANAVAINGSDVYITGPYVSYVDGHIARYWKNGVAVDLAKNADSNGIAVVSN